jgi:hypothetical protein
MMQSRFTPEELAVKILQKAFSSANQPNAKDSYIILRELKITKEMTGFVDSKHLSFSGIEEQFQTPIALALNTTYGHVIRSATITNLVTHDSVTYNLNQKLFEEKLLPDIEATYKPVTENRSSSITKYFKTLFARNSPASTSPKTETKTTPILLPKTLVI